MLEHSPHKVSKNIHIDKSLSRLLQHTVKRLCCQRQKAENKLGKSNMASCASANNYYIINHMESEEPLMLYLTKFISVRKLELVANSDGKYSVSYSSHRREKEGVSCPCL